MVSNCRIVVVLDFNRHPKELLQKIEQLKVTRDLLAKGVDVRPAWAGGAKILLEDRASAAFRAACVIRLDVRHVVCHPKGENELMQAVRQIPRRHAVYPKNKNRLAYVLPQAAHPYTSQLMCQSMAPSPPLHSVFVECIDQATTYPCACDECTRQLTALAESQIWMSL